MIIITPAPFNTSWKTRNLKILERNKYDTCSQPIGDSTFSLKLTVSRGVHYFYNGTPKANKTQPE